MNKELKISLAVIICIVTIAGLSMRSSFAQQGNTNYVLHPSTVTSYPSNVLETDVSISNQVDGTSNSVQYLYGCGSIAGNWTIQNNLLQSATFGYSWIQQAVAVGTSNACYTIEFWPDFYTSPSPDYASDQITTPSWAQEFYIGGGLAQFSIYSNYDQLTNGFIVYQFNLNTPNSFGWTIDPGTLTGGGPTEEYDGSSQSNFIMVGSGGGNNANFVGGYGSFNYCGLTSTSGLEAQSGETSNMIYGLVSSTSQTTCSYSYSPYYNQPFLY